LRSVLAGVSGSHASHVHFTVTGGNTVVSVDAGSGAGFVDMLVLQGITSLSMSSMIASGKLLI
jgi:hypothetical protein